MAPFSLKWTTSFLETALANKSSILQIFLQSKSGINQTTDSIVMAKKFTFSQQKVNFLALTFESVVWLIPNFGCRKICRIDDLFAKAVSRNEVVHLSEKGATWVRISCSFFTIKEKLSENNNISKKGSWEPIQFQQQFLHWVHFWCLWKAFCSPNPIGSEILFLHYIQCYLTEFTVAP